MVINVVLGYILSRFTLLGKYGIPLAYSVAVILGTIWLTGRLRKKTGAFGGELIKSTAQSIVLSAIMMLIVRLCLKLLSGVFASGSIMDRIILFALPTFAGIIVYFALAFIIRAVPMKQFLGMIRSRKENKA